MAIEKPSAGRAQIRNTGNGLQISISSKKNWFMIVFLSIWLCGWAFGEISVLKTLLSSTNLHGANMFMTIWLAGWTIGGAFCIVVLGWSLGGREIISLSNGILKVERKALNIGQTKEYSLADVTNLRIAKSINIWDAYSNFSVGMEFWGFGGGTISFDYGIRTVKFANGIDEAEASYLINEMKSYGYIK